ncbi:MAG: 1,4-dihydroxy-2-naphthoate polyprenyltransferase [Sandaracinaceae bacterium]
MRWLKASRPATLTAAVVPVAVGTACAHLEHGLAWMPALAALFGAIWIQIGTNFANDVYDAEKGADTEERLGPPRAVATGAISARAMKGAMIFAFACASLCGVYLVATAGWPILVIGVLSILSGIAYTGGPYPLGYHGLGDVFVFVFFGLVAVCGTAFVQLHSVPTSAWIASVPVGALATAILVVNNLRDRETDAVVGKRTLAVRLGAKGVITQYALLLVLAYGSTLALYAMGYGAPVLLPWLSAPIAVGLARKVATDRGRALNATLARTAQLLLLFGALLTVGLAWPR